jgi:putative addiction module killer protein
MRILEYVAANGKNHFKDWFERLPKIIQAKVERRLLRVQLGNLGDVRSLGGGVHELRIHEGPGYRVFVGNDGVEIILLLAGSDKRGQDVAIDLAHELWQEYKGRK